MGTNVDLYKYVDTIGKWNEKWDQVLYNSDGRWFVNWDVVEKELNSKDIELKSLCKELWDQKEFIEGHTIVLQ